MKSLPYTLLLVVLTFLACDDDNNLRGSGNVITEARDHFGFRRIDVEDALNFTVTFGPAHSVVVRADDNLIDRLQTSSSGDLLRVGLASGSYNNATFEITIVTPELVELVQSDATSGSVSGFLGVDRLRLEVNDASNLEFEGSTSTLELICEDASRIRAFDLTAANAEVRVRDASNVELTVTNELTGQVRDASTLSYRGQPSIDVSVSDASQLRNAN